MNKTIKKILIVFGFFIISLLLSESKAYAGNVLLCTFNGNVGSMVTEDVTDPLNKWYGYGMDVIYTPLYLGTELSPITIVADESGSDYQVTIGNESDSCVSARDELSFDDLCNDLGCPYEDEDELEENNYTWETILKVKVSYDNEGILNNKIIITLEIKSAAKITTGSDGTKQYDYGGDKELEAGDYTESDVVNIGSLAALVHSWIDFGEEVIGEVFDFIDDVADAYCWIKKFTTNAVGTITNLILDAIMNTFGDGPQLMINYVQTIVDGTAKDGKLLYSTDTLESDNTSSMYARGERNKYINITVYDSEDDSDDADDEADVIVEDTDDDIDYEDYDAEEANGNGYMFEDNNIPITAVDIYTMAANKVSFLDVNFLINDGVGSSSDIWSAIRDIIAKVIMACFYIAALILITALIWHGVKITTSSMNPRMQVEGKEGLNRFVSGVTMLVGSIVIMALSIYAYQAVDITENITGDSEYEFPIRVNVKISEKDWYAGTIKAQYYSFSTTITGYMRFMAQIENPDRCMEKAGYVIAYIILANMNLIIFIIMVARMLAMWILAPVGPILASLYAITTDQKMMDRFRTWAICYLILGCIQLVFAIAYWIMMECMGFN